MIVETDKLVRDVIQLEALGTVESWRFDDDAVHILLAKQSTGCPCRVPAHWFVNRDGRTRCVSCDDFIRTPAAVRVFAGQGKS